MPTAVLWVDGQEASPRQVRFISCALQTQLPLPFGLASLVLNLGQGGQRHFQVSRLDGFEEQARPGPNDPVFFDMPD